MAITVNQPLFVQSTVSAVQIRYYVLVYERDKWMTHGVYDTKAKALGVYRDLRSEGAVTRIKRGR